MTVKFYILQRDDQTDKTRDRYLFKDELSEMVVGKQITHLENKYEVLTLEFIDKTLKAVCLEVPQL
jgi:hypothetical protein